MSMKKRISVAMATYNGEKYIKEQLETILACLNGEDEIVISDDGSKDATRAVIDSVDFGPVTCRVIEGPHRGVKQNFAHAIAACEGRYIYLADQDDVWDPRKVELTLPILEGGCHLLCHDAVVKNGDLSEVIMPSYFAYRGSAPGFWHNLKKNGYMGCAMAFSAELVPYILPVPDDIEMHDWWIGCINDLRFHDTVFLPEQLLSYRRHESTVTDFSRNSLPVMIKNRLVFFVHILQNCYAKRHSALT